MVSEVRRAAQELGTKVDAARSRDMSNAARKQGAAVEPRAIDPILMTRSEAARALGISDRQFTRIMGDIPYVPTGKAQRKYDPEDLKQWAAERKSRGSSASERARKISKSISGTPANDTVSPQAAQIMQRLLSKQRESTPRLFPVGERKGKRSAK